MRGYLSAHAVVAEDAHFSFPEEKALSVISANYYGVVLGSYVGFDFGSFQKWAAFVDSLQNYKVCGRSIVVLTLS